MKVERSAPGFTMMKESMHGRLPSRAPSEDGHTTPPVRQIQPRPLGRDCLQKGHVVPQGKMHGVVRGFEEVAAATISSPAIAESHGHAKAADRLQIVQKAETLWAVEAVRTSVRLFHHRISSVGRSVGLEEDPVDVHEPIFALGHHPLWHHPPFLQKWRGVRAPELGHDLTLGSGKAHTGAGVGSVVLWVA